MAVYKRSPGGPWWVRFRVGGKLVRRSANTFDKQKAEEYEQALRNRFWRQVKLGESIHTWREAAQRYRKDATWRASTRTRNEYAFTFFERINAVPVAAINADVVRAAREYVERSQEPASANRIMAVFRGVLRACVKWGWLTHCPPVPMTHVPDRDPVWLTPEQCQALIMELPSHTRAPALFSALTGLRQGNVRDLKWSQVELERAHLWIPSSHYKTRRTHGVALSDTAVKLLKALPQEGEYVFTYKGQKIRWTFNTKAFRKARERAGLNCRWHDLRHTFASWLAAEGASDRVLQQMGGWTSPRMPARYAHLHSVELRPWANAIGTNAGTALPLVVFVGPEKPKRIMVPGRGFEPPTHALRMLRAVPGGKKKQ